MTSARDKLKKFFTDNRGKTVTGDELHEIAGIQTYPRRIRELRRDGWPILTNNDSVDLKPGEYRMEGKPPPDTYSFSKGISQRLRAEVLERNGYTCQMCGAGAGEPDENHRGRKVRLHVGHVKDKSHGGKDVLSNLRALCSSCNQGAKNITQEPPSHAWLLAQVRRAAVDDQKEILAWLRRRFGE